jgi:transcription antitermination factor NusA-like protein
LKLLIKQLRRVWVDEDQRSYAIGKSGQNIALAAKLVDLNTQLVQDEGVSTRR